jgi:capsule polysaccharide export protein KpsE/RkpR
MTRKLLKSSNATKDFFHIVKLISDEAKPKTILRELETYIQARKMTATVENSKEIKKVVRKNVIPSLKGGSRFGSSQDAEKFFEDYSKKVLVSQKKLETVGRK